MIGIPELLVAVSNSRYDIPVVVGVGTQHFPIAAAMQRDGKLVLVCAGITEQTAPARVARQEDVSSVPAPTEPAPSEANAAQETAETMEFDPEKSAEGE